MLTRNPTHDAPTVAMLLERAREIAGVAKATLDKFSRRTAEGHS